MDCLKLSNTVASRQQHKCKRDHVHLLKFESNELKLKRDQIPAYDVTESNTPTAGYHHGFVSALRSGLKQNLSVSHGVLQTRIGLRFREYYTDHDVTNLATFRLYWSSESLPWCSHSHLVVTHLSHSFCIASYLCTYIGLYIYDVGNEIINIQMYVHVSVLIDKEVSFWASVCIDGSRVNATHNIRRTH